MNEFTINANVLFPPSLEQNICYDTTQSKLNIRRLDSPIYRLYNEKKLYDIYEFKQRLRVFNALIQPGSAYQIFSPKIEDLYYNIMRGEYPEEIYIGLGYNGGLSKKGEKIDILDFLSWAKKVQNIFPKMKLTVWNAASYQVVNLHNKPINYIYDNNLADSIVSDILDLIEKEDEISHNVSLRTQYIQTIVDLFDLNCQVIQAEDKMKTEQFLNNFQLALDYCRDNNKQNLEIIRGVNRPKNCFAALYTPLEVAEALYLNEMYGCEYKLGPISEAPFDKIIFDISRQERKHYYKFIWYSKPPGRPASYLKSGKKSIYFGDTPEVIREKLEEVTYRVWLQDVIKPFGNPSLSLEENIIKISRLINSKICMF